jgi:hypothetical protein
MRAESRIVLALVLCLIPSLLFAGEQDPTWLDHACKNGSARPAEISDLNALFLNESTRRELRAQPDFCLMRLRAEASLVPVAGPLGDQYDEVEERVHGAVVDSERVCRGPGVALGITQLLADPELYHVFSPPPPHLFCGGFEFAFEFQTSMGQLDVLVLAGCVGIVTYWDGQQIASLPIAMQANRERLRRAIGEYLPVEGK